MAESIPAPRMTEPVPVPCNLVEGTVIEVRDEIVRIVGFVDLETVEDGEPPERRIVVRIAMPAIVARALVRDLRRATARGGH